MPWGAIDRESLHHALTSVGQAIDLLQRGDINGAIGQAALADRFLVEVLERHDYSPG